MTVPRIPENNRPCRFGVAGQRGGDGRCKCAECKEQSRLRKERWASKNRERANAHSAKWRASHPQRYADTIKRWRQNNPAKAQEIAARAGAKWSKKRADKRAAIRAKARATELSRVASWADMAAIEAFYTEAARLSADTGVPHEVDHIIPLRGDNVCGLHVETNLQIVTRSQNRAKGRRLHDAGA